MIQTYFSDIENALTENILSAKGSIKVAVAWFTNRWLFEALLSKLDEGISVELIIRDDYINNSTESLSWANFVAKGGKLYFSDSARKLHHKYCIIDNKTVISGSYNWTYQAESANQENVVIISEPTVADAFAGNFEVLKDESFTVDEFSLLNYRAVADAPVDEVNFFNEELKASKDAENIEDILDEAAVHYQNKSYDNAISKLNSAWDKVNSLPDAYETMAWSFARVGKTEEAIKYAEKGMLLDEKNPEFHNVIGYVYDVDGNHSKAVECFDKAINLAPNLTTYYWNKIFSLDKIGSNSIADKVATKLRNIASEVLKKKELYTSSNRMHAYIDRGNVSTDKVNREQDGLKAKAIFDTLDASQQDLHDLDSITVLIN